MSRITQDEIKQGFVKNGFDYTLQVWVKDFIILTCGHTDKFRQTNVCCNGYKFAGQDIRKLFNTERFDK